MNQEGGGLLNQSVFDEKIFSEIEGLVRRLAHDGDRY